MKKILTGCVLSVLAIACQPTQNQHCKDGGCKKEPCESSQGLEKKDVHRGFSGQASESRTGADASKEASGESSAASVIKQ